MSGPFMTVTNLAKSHIGLGLQKTKNTMTRMMNTPRMRLKTFINRALAVLGVRFLGKGYVRKRAKSFHL